jgi:hypothetical protein
MTKKTGLIALVIALCFASWYIIKYCRPSLRAAQSTVTFFKDPIFNFQVIRTLGHASDGGAEIGECMQTASLIQDGDFDDWYIEWKKLADRIYAMAQGSDEKGHHTSARDAYLRASNYYRTS